MSLVRAKPGWSTTSGSLGGTKPRWSTHFPNARSSKTRVVHHLEIVRPSESEVVDPPSRCSVEQNQGGSPPSDRSTGKRSVTHLPRTHLRPHPTRQHAPRTALTEINTHEGALLRYARRSGSISSPDLRLRGRVLTARFSLSLPPQRAGGEGVGFPVPMRAHPISVTIPEDRRVELVLPADATLGVAEVIVLTRDDGEPANLATPGTPLREVHRAS